MTTVQVNVKHKKTIFNNEYTHTFEVPEHKADAVERDIIADNHVMRYTFSKKTINYGMKTIYTFKIVYGKYNPKEPKKVL